MLHIYPQARTRVRGGTNPRPENPPGGIDGTRGPDLEAAGAPFGRGYTLLLRGDRSRGFVDRKRLNSKELRSVGYDARERALEVEFTRGRVVQYPGVGEDIHRRRVSAASPGSFPRQLRSGFSDETFALSGPGRAEPFATIVAYTARGAQPPGRQGDTHLHPAP